MTDERDQDPSSRPRRRKIGWTAALLAGVATLIYLGFIGRGVIG